MNSGLLAGIVENIDRSIINISDILCSEGAKLNYENEKKVISSLETLKSVGIIIHCMIDEENKKLDNKDNYFI